MKLLLKSKPLGSVSSDGSFSFLTLPGHFSQKKLNHKNLDLNNHPIWTGKRPKEQSEISLFVGKFMRTV
uniref:Ribosomal protein L31 n=1 Tax=Postelsia palmaeformis TaxID=105414 RepID=A0A8F0K0S6_9PHAE|nr:ribosomal protein L31 [Postelsia palmaeformis]